MTKIGLFPGTFNNLHIGHIDIIKKSLKIFDKLYLVIAKNEKKKANLTKNYNNTILKLESYNFKNLEIIVTNKDIPILFKELKCTHIIRGIRNENDFKYEIKLMDDYKNANKDISEIFFIADKEYREIESSQKKLFAFDIDGTLLNDKKEILKSTKKAIHNLIKNDHEVVLITGRHYLSTIEISNDLKIQNYIISSGGTTLYNIKSKKINITKNYLDKEDIDIAINLAKKYKRELIWNNSKNIYRVYFGNNPKKEIKDKKYFIGGSQAYPKYDVWENVKNTIYKNIIQISFKAESKIISSEIKKVRDQITNNCICYETSEVYIDFFYKDIGKYSALKKLSNDIGIEDSNIYVFGDSENDLEMISKFSNGIAMGNARPIVKKNAKYIIGNNNEDSIYNFLLEKRLIND